MFLCPKAQVQVKSQVKGVKGELYVLYDNLKWSLSPASYKVALGITWSVLNQVAMQTVVLLGAF